MKIDLSKHVAGFAEDKDLARDIRQNLLLPGLENKERIEIDFSGILFTTQSFVHALIGEGMKRFGDNFLDRVEFKACSPQVKKIIEIVVDYTLGEFENK